MSAMGVQADMLAFKLVVTPLLLLVATLTIRRWGESVGGLLIGLPLTSGPISLFLAIEHGPQFAANATIGSLIATVAQVVFCLVYCWQARHGWGRALMSACLAFAACAAVLRWLDAAAWGLVAIGLVGMTLTLQIVPARLASSSKVPTPWWDVPSRMALIAALVLGVTMGAPFMGPGVSGVLASFPFMATILAVFAHRSSGPVAGQQVLRGMVVGLYGFAVFFLVLNMTLERSGLWTAYGTATACALIVQGAFLVGFRR